MNKVPLPVKRMTEVVSVPGQMSVMAFVFMIVTMIVIVVMTMAVVVELGMCADLIRRNSPVPRVLSEPQIFLSLLVQLMPGKGKLVSRLRQFLGYGCEVAMTAS